MPSGQVYIVGAGPGDPGLLTVKGARLLATADVVLHDDLLDPRLLDHVREECEVIYAGHRGGRDSAGRQAQINQRLIDEARAGRLVVRLKGGDPYVYGRGGEEALALKEANVPFEVVSGVSAAHGVLAYAGIPLTHRNISTTATLVTGHEAAGAESTPVDWQALADVGGTLVVFMGSRRLSVIADSLMRAGRPGTTPAAVVQWGTWPRQRTVVSTLERIAPEAEHLTSPALIVVGDVVSLHEALNWFESKPLFGRRLLITRSQEQAAPLQVALESEGAEVISMPLLQITPPDDPSVLAAALQRLADFAWIVFTSPNAVIWFWHALAAAGFDSRALANLRVAAVGRSTAQRLADRGIKADLVPATQSAAGLADAFLGVDLRREQILLPASSIGRTELDEALAAQGATVVRVTAYENRPPAADSVDIPPDLTAGEVDAVLFASPSGVQHFVDVVGQPQAVELLRTLDIAVIGPTTASAVEHLGLPVAVQPTDSSIPALVAALYDHYGGR